MTDSGSLIGHAQPPAGKGLFISYRRGETGGQARALHDRLRQRFGADRVFMDVDSIFPGADFVQTIESRLGSCDVVIALIGRDWLSHGGDSNRFTDDPNDFVRLEIEIALKHNVPIIPILVERAAMPRAQDLPESMRPLVQIHAMDLENARWEFDVSRLIGSVDKILAGNPTVAGDVPIPIEPPARPRKRRRWRATSVILILAAALIATLVAAGVVVTRHHPPTVGAAGHVRAVPPENLAVTLLTDTFTPRETPPGVISPKVQLLNIRNQPGLEAYIRTGYLSDNNLSANTLNGNNLDTADLLVFATPALAQGAYSGPLVAPQDRTTGSFAAPGIADQVRCATAIQPASATDAAHSISVCKVLSSYVLLYVVTGRPDATGHGDSGRTVVLAQDAVRHLDRIASTTSSDPLSPDALTPSDLSAHLLTTEVASYEMAPPLTNPMPSPMTPSSQISGLLYETRVTFRGPDDEDYMDYFIFDTDRSASAWYAPGTLGPFGATRTGVIDSAGFDEANECGTFSRPAGTVLVTAAGQSACFLLSGNVVIESRTTSLSNLQGANNDLAVTLLRMALIHLQQAVAGRNP